MGKISFGLVFAALLLTASADVYDASTGYVTLIKDNITGTLTAFNSDVDKDGNKFWRDEAAPHQETNYYVAAKQTMPRRSRRTTRCGKAVDLFWLVRSGWFQVMTSPSQILSALAVRPASTPQGLPALCADRSRFRGRPPIPSCFTITPVAR